MSTSRRVHEACRRFDFAIHGGVDPDLERQRREASGYSEPRPYNSEDIDVEVIAKVVITDDYKVEFRPVQKE